MNPLFFQNFSCFSLFYGLLMQLKSYVKYGILVKDNEYKHFNYKNLFDIFIYLAENNPYQE